MLQKKIISALAFHENPSFLRKLLIFMVDYCRHLRVTLEKILENNYHALSALVCNQALKKWKILENLR